MPELDRIVSFTRLEEREVPQPTSKPFRSTYQAIVTDSPDGGLSAGRAAIRTDEGGITDVDDAANATAVYLSIIDANGVGLPHEFPSARLEVLTGGNGYRYRINDARHPPSRDRHNRRRIHTDTWRLEVEMVRRLGTGLAGFGVWEVRGIYIPGRSVTTSTLVTHRLWASRRDPGPTDQLHQVAGNLFGEVAIITTVWRFRADPGAVYPKHDERFYDDQGEQWEVFGIAESDRRRRFVDLFCKAIPGPLVRGEPGGRTDGWRSAALH